MASERLQPQVNRLLDEAEDALAQRNWETVREHVQDAVAIDPDNSEAQTFLSAADRALGGVSASTTAAAPADSPAPSPLPTSFVSGRYQVKRLLGERGKKKVYLAHEGLDDAARTRISREAQTMGRLGDHPHMVQIFDQGKENGQPLLVLPLMEGGDVEGCNALESK